MQHRSSSKYASLNFWGRPYLPHTLHGVGHLCLDHSPLAFLHQLLLLIFLVALKVIMWIHVETCGYMWKYMMLSSLIDQRSAVARFLSDTKYLDFMSSKRILSQWHWCDYCKFAHVESVIIQAMQNNWCGWKSGITLALASTTTRNFVPSSTSLIMLTFKHKSFNIMN